ncbi:DUF4167 domain-containing protein [Aliiruegeria haliotis]|uniref:DUF4167 domain-containing protein n=1 Tax=Aliiruegeria haliotis TaxID=1280846 RepID=UPI000D07FB3E|nr:DUF4167 domain-containing protein [Aliiruegeria haliotis]
MRSSKSRSRSKSNRQRSVGNIVNRVFDSSGPEGKVRGTPQQIIDKYTQLARDATLGNDRVAAENFQQHAEHYTRMLGEAQREQEARREQQEQQNRERQRERHSDNQQNANRGGGGGGQDQQPRPQQQPQHQPPAEALQAVDPAQSEQPDLIEDTMTSAPQPDLVGLESAPAADAGLVETPETAPKPKARSPRVRKPRAPKPDAPAAASTDGESADAPAAPAPKKRTRKAPAKKAEDAPVEGGEGPSEAAE